MKAVILGTDFVKDTDGTFKILETNTNVALMMQYVDNYFDIDEFNNFIVQNGIEDIKIINQSMSMSMESQVNDLESENSTGMGGIFDRIINYYSGTTITVSKDELTPNSVTVPYIEDLPNRLILRSAYDTTALIDDTYAKDNFEFLKLMHDENPTLLPKTYFVDVNLGFDTILNNIRDNGEYPNFIIKQRYPTINYSEYPKVLKITTQEELEEIKSTLSENTLLQEYIVDTNNLLNGKIKTYRSVDMIYGPNLDVYNLIEPFIHTNSLSIDSVVDYDNNNQIQYWERPKFLQKYANNKLKNLAIYKLDTTSKVWMSDDTLKLATNLLIGDELKTLFIPDLPIDEETYSLYEWTGTTSNFYDSTISATTITSILQIETLDFWLVELTLENGSVFKDTTLTSFLLKKENDNLIKFHRMGSASIGDTVFLVNKETQELEESKITTIDYTFTRETIYSMDVESGDLYLTLEENKTEPTYSIVQHNLAPNCLEWFCYGYFVTYSPCGSFYGYSGYYNTFCSGGYPYCDSYLAGGGQSVACGSAKA